MRIAYISPTFLSDVDISYLHEAQKINDIDYYICVNKGIKQAAAININSLKVSPTVHRIEEYEECLILGNFIDLSKTFVVNDTGNRAFSINTFRAYFSLYKRIKKGNYDCIHITWHPYLAYFWIYLFRKRTVMIVHDPLPHSSNKSKAAKIYRRFAFSLFQKFVILNQAQKNEFIKVYHIDKSKIYDSSLSTYSYRHIYDNKNISNIPHGEYVLYFGQITSHKGLEYLLRAFTNIHEKYPYLSLVIAGKGNFHFDISEYKRKKWLDLRNKFIPDDELAALIKNSKYVIAPYLDATQSGVVMSAFAYNKLCIVTNVGGLPSMVGDGKYGEVITPANSEVIEDVIAKLESDESLIKEIEQSIQNDFGTGLLSWKKIAEDMNTIYNTVLR